MIKYASYAVLALVAMFTLWSASFHVGYALAGPADTTPVLVAQADGGSGGSSSAAVDAGIPPAPTEVKPSDKLHDPVVAPVEAYDDFRAAQKTGWPLAVFAALVMLTKGLGTAGGRWSISWLQWLNKGTAAVVIAGMGTCGAAAFNTLALGGTWFAVMTAAFAALFGLISPTPKAPS